MGAHSGVQPVDLLHENSYNPMSKRLTIRYCFKNFQVSRKDWYR